MYLTESGQYYEITDIQLFSEQLNWMSFEQIKKLFKPTFQTDMLDKNLRSLVEKGYLTTDEAGYDIDLSEGVEFMKKYVGDRFGESALKKMISNFEADYDYKLRNYNNKTMLN